MATSLQTPTALTHVCWLLSQVVTLFDDDGISLRAINANVQVCHGCPVLCTCTAPSHETLQGPVQGFYDAIGCRRLEIPQLTHPPCCRVTMSAPQSMRSALCSRSN